MALSVRKLLPTAWLARLSSSTRRGVISASIWQIANYMIPLITLPYLAHVLGVNAFGKLTLGTAIIAYALLLTDWGFSLYGTQQVAQTRDRPEEVSHVIWGIVFAKAVVGTVSSIASVVGALCFVDDPLLRAVLLVSTLNVLASIVNVDWALRGMELLSQFAAASIFGRLLTVPLVFIMVHEPSQAPEAAFAAAAGGLASAAIAFVIAKQRGLLMTPRISIGDVRKQLSGSWHLFLSNVTINLYTSSLTLVVGLMCGSIEVGLYSGANKLRTAAHAALSPISMVAYPKMNAIVTRDPGRAAEAALLLLRVQGAGALALSCMLFVAAPLAVRFMLGSDFTAAIPVLQVQAWLIFVIALSNIFGLMIMLPFGMTKEFSRCVLAGAIVGFGLAFPMSYWGGALGASIAALLAEIVVTVLMYVAVARRFAWMPRLDILSLTAHRSQS